MTTIRRLIWPTAFALFWMLMSPWLHAQDAAIPKPTPFSRDKLLWTSAVAFTASTLFDAGTSQGLYELNPIARSADGRFGARGWVVAAGEIGAVCLVDWIAHRHLGKRGRDVLASVQFGFGAVHVIAGARNLRLR